MTSGTRPFFIHTVSTPGRVTTMPHAAADDIMIALLSIFTVSSTKTVPSFRPSMHCLLSNTLTHILLLTDHVYFFGWRYMPWRILQHMFCVLTKILVLIYSKHFLYRTTNILIVFVEFWYHAGTSSGAFVLLLGLCFMFFTFNVCIVCVSRIYLIFQYRSVSNNTWYRTSTRMASVFRLEPAVCSNHLLPRPNSFVSFYIITVFCCNTFPLVVFFYFTHAFLFWMCAVFSAYLAFQLLAGGWVRGVFVFSPLQQKTYIIHSISVPWQCLLPLYIWGLSYSQSFSYCWRSPCVCDMLSAFVLSGSLLCFVWGLLGAFWPPHLFCLDS